MVQALERGLTGKISKSYSIKAVKVPMRHTNSWAPSGRSHDWEDDGDDDKTLLPESHEMMKQEEESEPTCDAPVSNLDRGEQLDSATITDMEMMKERFSKLLLGEDMSGGGKGVSSALALSNSITNLAASIFGESWKLEPMPEERKARWRKEIGWFLSVTDHIVEFVPCLQKTKDGQQMEVMVTRQRSDLLVNVPGLRKLNAMLFDTLDNFGTENEFWYVSRHADESAQASGFRQEDKWWRPTVKVPSNGLSEESRKWLQSQKDNVNQVLKAAMAINAQVLSEMEIPENYHDSLPKNGRSSLGDSIYKSITDEQFDSEQFLATMDLTTELKVLDLKNRIEASILIWKRKMNQMDTRSSWSTSVSLERRELFEDRAETILLLLKQRFPGIPQSALEISKIQYNRDVGQSILESYSRVIETLAYKVISSIEDVLSADTIAQTSSTPASSEEKLEEDFEKLIEAEPGVTKKLASFKSWRTESTNKYNLITDMDAFCRGEGEKALCRGDSQKMYKLPPPSPIPKKTPHLDRLENLGGTRSPASRQTFL